MCKIKTPSMPPPPPPPEPMAITASGKEVQAEPPRAVDEAVSRARSDERRRVRNAAGYSSTIASGAMASAAETANMTLLGGGNRLLGQ